MIFLYLLNIDSLDVILLNTKIPSSDETTSSVVTLSSKALPHRHKRVDNITIGGLFVLEQYACHLLEDVSSMVTSEKYYLCTSFRSLYPLF